MTSTDPWLAAYEWRQRRLTPPTPAREREIAAEHEIAHGLVALDAGAEVFSTTIRDDGTGMTLFSLNLPRSDRAAVAVASKVWATMNFATAPEGDRGCGNDLRDLAEFAGDAFAVQEACRTAERILRRDAWMLRALATRLLSYGRLGDLRTERSRLLGQELHHAEFIGRR